MAEQLDTRKRCTVCLAVKPLHAYSRHSGASDGRHTTCKPCRNVKQREKWAADRKWESYFRDKGLRRRYGISSEQYEEMRERQGGACAVCRQVPEGNLCVDHSHADGQVRDLLCRSCNSALGLAKENAETLRGLAEYLERWREGDHHR